jgi:hypothetical protein
VKPGDTFGWWEIIDGPFESGQFLCRCRCGTFRLVFRSNLRRGVPKCQGCSYSLRGGWSGPRRLPRPRDGGSRWRRIRLAASVSAAYVADTLGVSSATVSRFESGERCLSGEVYALLVDCYRRLKEVNRDVR